MALDGGRIESGSSLVQMLIAQLRSAADLISRLDEAAYSDGAGSIGAHIRHNLNFVEAVVEAASTRSIDYSQRTRDRRIETERLAAAAKINELIARIKGTSLDLAMPLTIRSEVDAAIIHSSSLGRELEFVISHTIHHHALIKERLQQLGIEPDEQFGVAPSTLEYRKALKR